MSEAQQYQREANGQRFSMTGINTVAPIDALGANYPYLQNVRSYLQGRMKGRSLQTAPVETLGAPVHTLRRLNDTTPAGPMSGYALIGGAGNVLYCNATNIATGMSGNPLSFIPFRPNESPQPWMYVGDSSQSVEITASSFPCTGMLKVRSDGLTYKMGVKEPQDAPTVGTQSTTTTGTDTVLGTARPWSNVGGVNPSFNYGDNGNGTGPVVIATPIAGSTLTLTATGTVTISGTPHGPGDSGPTGSSNPGQFVAGGCAILMGAWTDDTGVIVAGTGAGPVSIGDATTLTVPTGASQLQIGIDGTGGAFSGNTGSFTLDWTLETSSVTNLVSLLGTVTAYYWGDSPHTGPVAAYIWKNAGDTGGSGPVRDVSTATGTTTNNSLIFDSPTTGTGATPMMWSELDDTGAVTGSKPVFQPALESEGYQDFNMCITGNLFVPAGGTYSFTITSKDNVMWGIGNNATWTGINTLTGALGQTETVASMLPLLPSPTIDGEGAATSVTVAVTFPGSGIYPIELDYDYWDHSGRTLTLTVEQPDGSTVIPPVAGNVKESVSYRYVYRSSITGATSNPSPASPVSQVPSISNTITPEYSNDPQVDKVDYYRMDTTLDNYTYVGTGPNTNPPTSFTDQLLDSDVADNPILSFDNYEPFPSIDLPKGGTVNVIGGIVDWVSGDQFNERWLAGTIINIGGIAYTLLNRPSSATTLQAIDVADGTDLTYEISEPILAAQPLASMFGDTDNTIYAFAVGDPLRPGTLYWCMGNNLDSAPDTNQQDVTSPSEPLINGVIANGIGMVMSADNAWVIYPNFSSALATVNGVSGSAWTLTRSSVTRGLYIRPCICTDGSGTFFYRSKDGIETCVGLAPQQSLTNSTLYNLFPHEGFEPTSVTVAGFTVVPPDDTQPEQQRLAFATGYLYYDYQGIDGNRHTLVFDVAGGGWVVDVYQWPATIHMLEEGPNVNGVLTGCSDGSVRSLSSAGTEAASSVVLTGAVNAGDARASKTVGDVFFRASVASAVSVSLYSNQYATLLTTVTPGTLAPGTGLQPYIVDFGDGNARDVIDIEASLVWNTDTTTYLDLWQPDWTSLPETSKDRPTDWGDMGTVGPNFVQGVTLEANTFNVPKAIRVQSDDLVYHTPDQSPVTFNGQSKQTLTFTPPFVAYMVRIVSTDGVPWNLWPTPDGAWTKQPYPPSVTEWQTQFSAYGNKGWQHIRELNVSYISTTTVTVTIQFDPGASPNSITLTVPSSNGLEAKLKVTVPVNKFKLASFRLSSSAPFRVFGEDFECKIGQWGRADSYRDISVIGASSGTGATV